VATEGERRTVVVVVADGVDLVSIELVNGRPDLGLVDSIARLGLAARRIGCTVAIRDPCPELVPLLHLVGLAQVFPVSGSGAADQPLPSALEAVGQAEDGEEVGVEEMVVPRDPPT
jgi:hypothetical protein